MKPHIIFVLILTWFLQSEGTAQLQLWDVFSASNQPFTNIVVDRYESDSLYIKSMGHVIVLHQDSIKFLLRKNKSRLAVGVLVGSLAGGLFANRMVCVDDENPFSGIGSLSFTTLGIVVGGLLGGTVGAGAGADTKFQIAQLNSEGKRKLLSRLFPDVIEKAESQ